MGLGIGVGLGVWNTPRRVVSALVISVPLSGHEFVVGVPDEVSGTSTGLVGATLQAAFTPTFDDIVGTSGVIPAGGAWSMDVTAEIGDVG